MTGLAAEIGRRRTFAIISHPDAGKTTLTEKLLLFGGAIQMAGAVKGRKAARHATSDWMRLEQQRGISVTSSVMQFPYRECIVNLLDTPGHEDFSEDTYRTLTAVDSALMVIDCAKGVEERTIKLMEVCRLRDTPILTFINKLDRDGRPPIELLDEIESVLRIHTAPVTWPIGMGRELHGIYHLLEDRDYVNAAGVRGRLGENRTIDALESEAALEFLGDRAAAFREEVELVRGATQRFDPQAYLAGRQTPVFFGSAINNFGVERLVFTGVPNFAPETFRRARLVEPLKMKALQKGLSQLCEEGATQLFRPLRSNELILGAVGPLQFEVVAFRLEDEYGVQCVFDPVAIHTARWVESTDARRLAEFRARAEQHLALDHSGALVYLAPSRVNLELTIERFPDIRFHETREHASG